MTSSDLWDDDVASRYDDASDPMFSPEVLDPTVDLLAELAGAGPALELAIGTGRVAVPLHRRGVPVAGIELSPPMVAVLRTKADDATIPVVVGDMATAEAPGAGTFRLVYLVFNTIGNLVTQDAQVECFANAARHLAPGGRFLIEVGVPSLRRLPPTSSAVPFDVSAKHVGFDTFDLVTQQAVSHHYTREPDGRFRYGFLNFRFVWPSELDLMARLAGLEREHRWAGWDRSPFTSESRSHVSVWRKPA
ncbi:class I SAM-dependent DNA methyltransferase [Xylanimonas sp. McL0601]|uniref:class I SAM-dependent DNA methyltransferase n=1 Tax=Xylanimonas sp. McL0601 TaxID=3414739 RepID=UPI003CE7D678